MKTSLQRCLAGATGAVLLVSLLSACVVEGGGGGGYGYDSNVDVGVDYYQPVGGVVVGSWGPGYHVGPPPRGGDDHRGDDHRGPGDNGHRPPDNGGHGAPGNAGSHAYKPAPPSHSAPSIPSRGRR